MAASLREGGRGRTGNSGGLSSSDMGLLGGLVKGEISLLELSVLADLKDSSSIFREGAAICSLSGSGA